MRAAALLVLALLAATLLPPPAPASQGSLGVSPARLDLEGLLPGDRREATLLVRSGFDDPASITVRLTGSIAPWVVVEPLAFELAAGDSVPVQVLVAIPADVPPVGYSGAIRFEAEPAAGPGGSGSAVRRAVLVGVTLDVGPSPIVALRISPSPVSAVATDTTPIPVRATGIRADGVHVPLRPQDIAWSVEPADAAVVENEAVVHAGRLGLHALRVEMQARPDLVAYAPLAVSAGPLARLEIVPAAITLGVGQRLPVAVEAFDAADNILPSPPVRWTIHDSRVATLDGSTVVASAVGTTVLSARDSARDLSDEITVRVVATAPRVAALSLTPAQATVSAGETLQLEALATSASGAPVQGAAVQFATSDSSVAVVDPSGLVTTNLVGRAVITATTGTLSATSTIDVVPGRVARIDVTPSSVTLSSGGTVQFTGVARDARGNVVPDAAIQWAATQLTGGVMSPTGFYQAGDVAGSTVVTASVGVVRREVVVFEFTEATADAGGGTVPAAVTTSTHAQYETTSYVSGFADVEAGGTAAMGIPPDSGGAGGALTAASATFGAAGSNVALSLELQPGSLRVVPAEVDAAALTDVVTRDLRSPEPGLFISVSATRDGQTLSSAELNELLDSLDVSFDVPASYFQLHRLDPSRVRILEFSDGALMRADLPATLTTPLPRAGAYGYATRFEDFSSFAFVAEPLDDCVGEEPLEGVTPAAPATPGENGGAGALGVVGVEIPSWREGDRFSGTVFVGSTAAVDASVGLVVRLIDAARTAVYVQTFLDHRTIPAGGTTPFPFDLGFVCVPPGSYLVEILFVDPTPDDIEVPDGSVNIPVEVAPGEPDDEDDESRVPDGDGAPTVQPYGVNSLPPAPDIGDDGGGGDGAARDASGPSAAIRLTAPAREPCTARAPCTAHAWEAVFAANVAGLDPARAWTWAWTFGDGATADGSTVAHRFDERGTWPILLRVTDGLAVARARAAVTVSPPLRVDAVGDGDGWDVEFLEDVRRVEVLIRGSTTAVYDPSPRILYVASEGANSALLKVTDVAGVTHHVVLTLSVEEMLETAGEPAVRTLRLPGGVLPWWLLAAATVIVILVVVWRRRRDEDERRDESFDPPP